MEITLKAKKDALEIESTRSAWDSGAYGKSFEESLTGHHVKSAGKVDYNARFGKCEIKTGAGELENVINSKCKYVIYEPVAQGEPYYQGIFVLERETFLSVMEEIGAIRKKTRTNGTKTVTIQTFYNRSLHKPHGRLLYKIVEVLEENNLL
jgi:hypothetical protein